VREDSRRRDVRPVGDLAHAHRVEAALEEQFLRRVQDRGPGDGLLTLAPPGLVLFRSHARHRTKSDQDWLDTETGFDTLS
jgi:hypothetical protein